MLTPEMKALAEKGVAAATALREHLTEANKLGLECYMTEEEGVDGVRLSFQWLLDNPEKVDECGDDDLLDVNDDELDEDLVPDPNDAKT